MSLNNNLAVLTKGIPKPALAAFVILAVSLIALVVLMIQKQSVYSTEEVISGDETTSGKEITVSLRNATLYIPGDTATMPGVISITTSNVPNSLFSVGETEWLRPQVVNIEYLDADGAPYPEVKFSNPALICFKITEKQWRDYTAHPQEYQVQYADETQTPNSWVALPMVARPDQYQLCGQTDHLSIFALAMQPQGGIPITGGTLVPTGSMTPTATINPAFSPTHSNGDGSGFVATPVSTQAALTATSVALTATDVPPTSVPPTNIPPTSIPPTSVPPTSVPTIAPTDEPTVQPTNEPPTNEPPTNEPPTNEPPTNEPPTNEPPPPDPPTEPPAATAPPVTP